MTSTITPLFIGGLGGMEMIIILAVLVLLFGASKLPELARGSGQALRIFKSETKGLMDSDKREKPADAPATQHAQDAQDAPTVSEPIIVETPREHDAPRG